MKDKIALITDSASDMNKKFIEKHNIKIIPLRILYKNKTYLDKIQLKPEDMYDMLNDDILPKTSLPSAEDITSVLDEVKSEGYHNVLYIGLSSALSGTYNFVKLIGEEYNDINFFSFDSKTLSAPQGMLVSFAAKLIEKGESNAKRIIYKLSESRKENKSLFVVKNISYLTKGGRISKATGFVGNLLKVCPVINIGNSGNFELKYKSIGLARSIQLMLNDFEKNFKNSSVNVSIVHCFDEKLAKSIIQKIKSFADIINVDVLPVTAALAIHTGPGLVGISMNKV